MERGDSEGGLVVGYQIRHLRIVCILDLGHGGAIVDLEVGVLEIDRSGEELGVVQGVIRYDDRGTGLDGIGGPIAGDDGEESDREDILDRILIHIVLLHIAQEGRLRNTEPIGIESHIGVVGDLDVLLAVLIGLLRLRIVGRADEELLDDEAGADILRVLRDKGESTLLALHDDALLHGDDRLDLAEAIGLIGDPRSEGDLVLALEELLVEGSGLRLEGDLFAVLATLDRHLEVAVGSVLETDRRLNGEGTLALDSGLTGLLRLAAYEEDGEEGDKGPEVMKLFHDHFILEIIISG